MNKNRLIKIGLIAIFVCALAIQLAPLAHAATSTNSLEVPQPPNGVALTQGNIQETILKFINIFLGFVGIIAVGFIIIGGFRYIISAGNDEAAEAGKKTLTNAIIGLIIIIFSYVIVNVLITTLRN